MVNSTLTDYSFDLSRKEKSKTPQLNEAQLQVFNMIKNGWTLYRNKLSFKWYLKKKADYPFVLHIITLNKTPLNFMLSFGIIQIDESLSTASDFVYVLK